MATADTGAVIRRVVPLAARERIIFDRANGIWRVVYYRATRETDRATSVDPKLFHNLVKTGMMPHSKPFEWARFTACHESLQEAIRDALAAGDSTRDPFKVYRYIASTRWGEGMA